MLGLIAGQGVLPVLVSEAVPRAGLRVAVLDGSDCALPSDRIWRHFRLETLGTLLADLREAGVTEICFAGGITRPQPDPALVDELTRPLLRRLLDAIHCGDDAALRIVIEIFEEHGITVRGAHEIRPDLLADPSMRFGPQPLTEQAGQDMAHGARMLTALSPLDVGQAVVIERGQCLGIETMQGTRALLEFVATTDARKRGGHRGVLIKGPKLGQDLRIDMPAIGPGTIQQAARAGLGVIAVQAGKTLILDREAVAQEARFAQVALVVRDFGL